MMFFAILLCCGWIDSVQSLSSIPRRAADNWNAHSATVFSSQQRRQDGYCGGRIVTLHGLFNQEPLLQNRDVKVWLPPKYDNDDITKRYPVLYCHDGQNAMMDPDSWTGTSWRLAATLTRLSACIQIPIIVMLPSANGDLLPGLRRRHLEYSSLQFPMALSHTHVVGQVVKPTVDHHFRTLPGANHTFAMGSSLGGQASLNLLLKYPNMFGGAACMSPYFSADTIASAGDLENKRIYLDIGGDSANVKVSWFDLQDHLTEQHWWNPGYFWLDTSLQASVTAMRAALGNNNVQHRTFPGARHNERAWAERIHWPLLHLLGNER